MARELTTVSDDHAVVHDGTDVRVYEGLRPGTRHDLDGFTFRTLDRPGGELLCRFATVNDVHFGEIECGVVEGLDAPVLTVPDGAEPYPVVMNRGAIAEITAIEPAAVLAKGDLTAEGTPEQYQEFLDHYLVAFGQRLHHLRGNHDAYRGAHLAPQGPIAVQLPGVTLAMIDTVRPGHANGRVRDEQLEWLDAVLAERDTPVLVFGHHHVWRAEHDPDAEWFFGIRPRDTERLVAVAARRPTFAGYFAGHTHRNRVVRLPDTGAIPWVEVACVKDYPGSWAEYRVFEGGILQVHHRVSTVEALAWSEQARRCYSPFIDYTEYALGALDDRCFRVR